MRPPAARRRRRDDSPARRRRDRPPRPFVLLREIHADTPVHRLWAGTKLLGAAAVSLTISFLPQWGPVAVLTALLVGTGVLARVPLRAVPRPPRWFVVVAVVGAALTVASGGRPEVAVGAGHVGLGGVGTYLLFVSVSVLLLATGALIGWTTSLGDIGPAVGRLLAPLRLLRLPVEEWATTIALCVRGLPLLVSEVRTLVAARRLRPLALGADAAEAGDRPPAPDRLSRAFDELGDLLVAAVGVTLRRAAEMGEAITARGGASTVTARASRPRRRDAAALVVVALACGGAWLTTV